MSEDRRTHLTIGDLIEGGWQKPVAPPKAQAYPGGLPPAAPHQQQVSDNPPKQEKRHE